MDTEEHTLGPFRARHSTSGRLKWKERHRKGEFATKPKVRGGKQRKKWDRADMRAFNRKK